MANKLIGYQWYKHGIQPSKDLRSIHLHRRRRTTIKGLKGPVDYAENTAMCGRYQKQLVYAWWPENASQREVQETLAKRGCKKCMRAYQLMVTKEVIG